MTYTTETKNYGQITDSVFIQENGLGFDFSDQSEITFVQFNGIGGPGTSSVAKILTFWKRYFYKKFGHHVNVVLVRDGGREFGEYTANYLGIAGICSSVFELANLLNNKIYLKNGTTKKTVVFADCAGAFPAVITSSIVPYHSINLTTPHLRILGTNQDFDSSQKSAQIAKTHSSWIYEEIPEMRPWFDTIGYLESFTTRPENFLNLHWAKNITGPDLMFRNQASQLKKSNVSITDHEIPLDVEGHQLIRHLISTKEYYRLVDTEVYAQFAALGIETKVTGL